MKTSYIVLSQIEHLHNINELEYLFDQSHDSAVIDRDVLELYQHIMKTSKMISDIHGKIASKQIYNAIDNSNS